MTALHRYSFVNSAFLAASVPTASSQTADLLASNVRNQARGALWRSQTGWNVVAGFNDLFIFYEGAGPSERRATFTPGNYATGDDYAAMVQAAMNAAPSVSNTYTVTYSATTNKFTETRATGVAAFGIKPLSAYVAADRAQAAIRDLGYKDTGNIASTGTSYEGDTAVHHSLEYVDLDQGPAEFRVVILGGQNGLDVKFGAGSPDVYYIEPGVYSDPAVLADAIEAATNSAGDPIAVITVAWDAALNKLTITSSFVGTMHLLFGTGASAVGQTSAHVALGWASTDVSLATAATTTADNATYGWNPVQFAAVFDHNSGGGGAHRVILSDAPITGQVADAANVNAYDFDLTGNELVRLRLLDTFYGDSPTVIARRYARLVIDDQANADAYSELGIWWLGPVLEPADDFVSGFTDNNDPKDVVQETEYGAVVGELRPAPHEFSGQHTNISNQSKDALQEMQDYTGLVRPVVFMRDALNRQRLVSMTWYMRLAQRLVFTAGEGANDAQGVVNPFAATWSVSVPLREILP